jgi:hypothetical protein
VSAAERRCEQLVRVADIMAGMVAESRGGYMRPPFTPSTEVRAKISREFGKTQIERLMGKEFAPSRPSVISDMITTLAGLRALRTARRPDYRVADRVRRSVAESKRRQKGRIRNPIP